MSDFEDVDVADTAQVDSTREGSEDLDMEDVELDADQSAKDLQDMYAAAYKRYRPSMATGQPKETTNKVVTKTATTLQAVRVQFPSSGRQGQHRGVEISMGSRTTSRPRKPSKSPTTFLLPVTDRTVSQHTKCSSFRCWHILAYATSGATTTIFAISWPIQCPTISLPNFVPFTQESHRAAREDPHV